MNHIYQQLFQIHQYIEECIPDGKENTIETIIEFVMVLVENIDG